MELKTEDYRLVVSLPWKRKRGLDDVIDTLNSKKRRPEKPPYTYLSMMTVAIEMSPNKRLTLLGITNALKTMFSFFRGEYEGWRDSVRHTLSCKPCFVRIKTSSSKPTESKGSFWQVDLSRVPPNAFMRTTIKNKEQTWAETLTQQLGIPDIILPNEEDDTGSTTNSSIQPSKTEVPSNSSTAKLAFNIDNILGFQPTEPMEPPDKKTDHPYSFLGIHDMFSAMQSQLHPTNSSSFSGHLYNEVNGVDMSTPKPKLCPDPVYGEVSPYWSSWYGATDSIPSNSRELKSDVSWYGTTDSSSSNSRELQRDMPWYGATDISSSNSRELKDVSDALFQHQEFNTVSMTSSATSRDRQCFQDNCWNYYFPHGYQQSYNSYSSHSVPAWYPTMSSAPNATSHGTSGSLFRPLERSESYNPTWTLQPSSYQEPTGTSYLSYFNNSYANSYSTRYSPESCSSMTTEFGDLALYPDAATQPTYGYQHWNSHASEPRTNMTYERPTW